MKKVYVGLSGGVDSSVSALRLKELGYEVVGAYMKNWSRDLPGFQCPWMEDYHDAKRVTVQLGIAFEMFDFETEYHDLVVGYMLEEFKKGNTPNPDIMCNQEIKFKLFLEAAKFRGADLIATGHYAQTKDGKLLTAVDDDRDQTYFLYRVTSDALKQTIFPVGDLRKAQVRRLAAVHELATAHKKESMGICFVGNVGIKDFLKQYIETSPGPLIDQYGREIGCHDGAIFYTIGQRHGFAAGGGLPYYVTSKDMATNTVYVTTQLDDPKLWQKELRLRDMYWINEQPEAINLKVRLRHRGPLHEVVSLTVHNETAIVTLKTETKAISKGQSAVFYRSRECFGGGIVT